MSKTPEPITSISVVMAVCNGQRYLPEQLHSIGEQDLQPTELVVGDDQSDDDTLACIQAFARAHPGVAVRVERNARRLGVAANFEQTVRRARGDIVVFSDQDDIWRSDRLARLVGVLTADPDCTHVFSDGSLIDGAGVSLKGSLFGRIDFGPDERSAFTSGEGLQVLLRRNVVTGATLAVRRTVLQAVLPFEPGWMHDYYIALMLGAVGKGVMLGEPLIRYRLHAGQQVGVARNSWSSALAYARKQSAEHCRAEARAWQAIRPRLAAAGVDADAPVLAQIDHKVAFLMVRAAMRDTPIKAPALITRLMLRGQYGRYSLGLKQAAVDALSAALAWQGFRSTSR
jgi:glycosyltransferase involved in cell wall biosynthesis